MALTSFRTATRDIPVSTSPSAAIDSTTKETVGITGGPWNYKSFIEWVQELAFTINGFDFYQEPCDPVTGVSATGLVKTVGTSGVFTMPASGVRGSARPEVIFEFGTGKNNLTDYSYTLNGENLITRAWSLPPAFPNGQVVNAGNWSAITALRLREEVIQSDLVAAGLRQRLASEHINIRKQYRQVFTFTPQVEDGTRTPRFGIDYDIGDYIVGRIRDKNVLLLAGIVRVYGANIEIDDNGMTKTTLTLVQEI